MRMTITLDSALVKAAEDVTGISQKDVLIGEALQALVERESARRLASLRGKSPRMVPVPRRRLL